MKEYLSKAIEWSNRMEAIGSLLETMFLAAKNPKGCMTIIIAVVLFGSIVSIVKLAMPDPALETQKILATFPAEDTEDGWGNPIRVEHNKQLLLWETWIYTSAGPDGEMGTGDDIIKKRRLRR